MMVFWGRDTGIIMYFPMEMLLGGLLEPGEQIE